LRDRIVFYVQLAGIYYCRSQNAGKQQVKSILKVRWTDRLVQGDTVPTHGLRSIEECSRKGEQ